MIATWLISLGILLLVFGCGLRIALMMHSSDATPHDAAMLYGRELLRQYRHRSPHNLGLLLMRSLLIGGAALLLGGLIAQFGR